MITIKAKNEVVQKALEKCVQDFIPESVQKNLDLGIVFGSNDEINQLIQNFNPSFLIALGGESEKASVSLPTPCPFQKILEIIEQLKENQEVITWKSISLDLKRRQIKQKEILIPLTEQEVQFIKFLIQHPSQKIHKEDLLVQVWGYHSQSQTHTIETHVYALRQKLKDILDIKNENETYWVE